MKDKFAVISKDYIEIKDQYPEMYLLHAIFGGDIELHRRIFDSINVHLKYALDTLTPRESMFLNINTVLMEIKE